MNDDGKSDKPIVPRMDPNKVRGRRPRTAEGPEGRGLAKGNPTQQLRHWTQGQFCLQQSLGRVRNA